MTARPVTSDALSPSASTWCRTRRCDTWSTCQPSRSLKSSSSKPPSMTTPTQSGAHARGAAMPSLRSPKEEVRLFSFLLTHRPIDMLQCNNPSCKFTFCLQCLEPVRRTFHSHVGISQSLGSGTRTRHASSTSSGSSRTAKLRSGSLRGQRPTRRSAQSARQRSRKTVRTNRNYQVQLTAR